MYLLADSPEVNDLFQEWLYTKEIRDGNSQKYLKNLYDLYFFGEKVESSGLMDKTIDKIQDPCRTYDKCVDVDLLIKIYRNTCDGSNLRGYGCFLFSLPKK
jgi:hypothetical protein